MAIQLASNQTVSFGVVDIYRTFPWSVAALVNPASLSDWNAIFSQGANDGEGWYVEISSTGTPHMAGQGGASFDGTALPAANEWYTIVFCYRDATHQSIYTYRHKTGTLTQNNGTASIPAPGAPSATNTVIGAWGYIFNNFDDYFDGKIGWVQVSASDYSESGSANPKAVWELIMRGPWGLVDSNCKGLWVLSGDAVDRSGNAHNGTLTNSPTYVESGPTELPPWLVIPVRRQPPAGGGSTTYNLQSDMRGRGGEQLTPTLEKAFTGNLDAYGKDQLIPGKTLSGASGNFQGKSGASEKLTPAKSFSLVGNFLGKAGEAFTPGKAFGLAATLDGLGKLSGTVGKTLGVRLEAAGLGLLSGMPQLISGVQYLLKGDFRGRGDTQATLTQTLQTAAKMRGNGEAISTPARQGSISGNMRGVSGEAFTPVRAAQIFANMEAGSKLSGMAQKTGFAKAVMVGRGWLRAFFGTIRPVLPRPVVTIVEAPRPTATIAEVTRPVAAITMSTGPVASLVEAARPEASIEETTRPTATISEVKP